MEKKSVFLLALLTATLGVLSACGSSNDNIPVVAQIPKVLHSIRAKIFFVIQLMFQPYNLTRATPATQDI